MAQTPHKTHHSPKKELISSLKKEHATTKKVLNAFPANHSEMKPHPTSQAARELVHTFAIEAGLSALALENKLEMPPKSMPKAPPTWSEALGAYEASLTNLLDVLEKTDEDDLSNTVQFMVGPKQMGDMPKIELVRFMLNDHIHHRGQLSVYLRMTGAKVPSIYGPSKDEPWF